MNLMKQLGIAVPCLMIIGISGCAQSLPPHEELNQAFRKSFDASGLNYSSTSRITNLSMPIPAAVANSTDKRIQYLGTGLDIIRGLSVNLDGAIDLQTKRSEVLYDLHYNKDNVEVSVKIPLLMDYGTQTLYVGASFFTTVLETLYPQAPPTRGKLIRVNISELLQEGSASTAALSQLIGANRFSSKNMDAMNAAFKTGILQTLAKLDDTCISDQPLTESDRKAGVERRIRVNLGHSDSVSVVLNLIDGVSQALLENGVISNDEMAVLRTLTDKQTLDGVSDKFTLAMTFDIGIAPAGFVGHLESQLSVADKDGLYQLGLNNVSSFHSYNAPRFSMSPEVNGIVDFKDVLGAMVKDPAQEPGTSSPDLDDCDEPEITPGAAQ